MSALSSPFAHSATLNAIFTAPAEKTAILTETPDPSTPGAFVDKEYTYAQLRHDSLHVALNVLRPLLPPYSSNPNSSSSASESELASFIKRPAVRSPFHDHLLDAPEADDAATGGNNVAILVKPGYDYVVSLIATWLLNRTAVPICFTHHYDPEMMHVLATTGASAIIVDQSCISGKKLPQAYYDLLGKTPSSSADAAPNAEGSETLAVRGVVNITETLQGLAKEEGVSGVEASTSADPLPSVVPGTEELIAAHAAGASPDGDCLIIFTSGTTSKPKGAVHTHNSLSNQAHALHTAWKYTSDDIVLDVLPLHHIHGLVNNLITTLAKQATTIITSFDPMHIARRLKHGGVTVFPGVPTVFIKLDDSIKAKFSEEQQLEWRDAVKDNVRLFISGSSSLPEPVLDAFRRTSGHTLLERYGMTEIGMGLSQPYEVSQRVPTTVGFPLPTVQTYVLEKVAGAKADENPEEGELNEVPQDLGPDVRVGALMIRSPSLFSRYWNNPTATAKEVFTHPETKELYFNTGDTASEKLFEGKKDAPLLYSLLGRSSVDIIKKSGFKISALEIESEMLQCPAVKEVAVVGVPHRVMGEEVCALTVLADDDDVSLIEKEIKPFVDAHLARYKQPTQYIHVKGGLKRNAMGKVSKVELKKDYGFS